MGAVHGGVGDIAGSVGEGDDGAEFVAVGEGEGVGLDEAEELGRTPDVVANDHAVFIGFHQGAFERVVVVGDEAGCCFIPLGIVLRVGDAVAEEVVLEGVAGIAGRGVGEGGERLAEFVVKKIQFGVAGFVTLKGAVAVVGKKFGDNVGGAVADVGGGDAVGCVVVFRNKRQCLARRKEQCDQ